MPRTKSVFVTSETRIATLSIKVPASIKERIETLCARISEIDPDLTFDANAICVASLEKALDNGESELGKLQKNKFDGASADVDHSSEARTSL